MNNYKDEELISDSESQEDEEKLPGSSPKTKKLNKANQQTEEGE